MITRDELLKELMKHSVTGHVQTRYDNGEKKDFGYHSFCNDPQHALKIINDAGYILRPKIGGNPTENLAVLAAENEGMFPAHGAHPVYNRNDHEFLVA